MRMVIPSLFRTIGIQLEQVNKAQHVLAIAAGENKVTALQAYFKNAAAQTVLVTDEQTAKTILAQNKSVCQSYA